jgi:hypothetical protein
MRPLPLVPEDLNRLTRVQQDKHLRSLARAAIASAMYSLDKGLRNFERRSWPNDSDVELILRGASPPTSMASAPDLAPIVPSFLASLLPLSAGVELLQQGLVLTWNGAGGISLPTITTIPAEWLGEGLAIPVKAGTTAPGKTLLPFKLAVISTLTGEMIRSSNAEAIVTDTLRKSVAPAIDAALFSNAAGVPGQKPPGILNGVAPLTASTATPLVVAMAQDLAALGAAVAQFAGNGRILFAAAPRQALFANIAAANLPSPILMSNSIPDKSVIAVASPAIASVIESTPRVDSSLEVLLHEETNAQPIVTAAGAVATPVRSVWQTDSAAIRLILPISWTVRNLAAVAWMSAVSW